MYLKSLGQSYTGIPIPDTLKNHSVPTRTASRQCQKISIDFYVQYFSFKQKFSYQYRMIDFAK